MHEIFVGRRDCKQPTINKSIQLSRGKLLFDLAETEYMYS